MALSQWLYEILGPGEVIKQSTLYRLIFTLKNHPYTDCIFESQDISLRLALEASHLIYFSNIILKVKAAKADKKVKKECDVYGGIYIPKKHKITLE